MAQHLCIVARDNPLLLGYLNIALQHLRGEDDELEIVIDRRPPPASLDGLATPATSPAVEQRRLGVDAQLQARGYAIVSREEGEPWRLTGAADAGFPSSPDAESAEQAGEIPEVASDRARSRRLPVGSVAVIAALVLAAWIGVPGSAMDQHTGVARTVLTASAVKSAPVPSTPASAAVTVPPRVREVVAMVAPAPVTAERAPVAPPAEPVAVPTAAPVSAAPAAPAAAPLPPAAPPPVSAPPPRLETTKVSVAPPPKPESGPKAPARTEPARTEPARTEKARPPSQETVAPPPAPPVVEFQGIPRVEMSRERDADGRTAAILVRLTDQGGRPLTAAGVRVRRHLADGAVNETRLQATGPEGSYRGRLPAAAANSNGLTMRIEIGTSHHEVPLAE